MFFSFLFYVKLHSFTLLLQRITMETASDVIEYTVHDYSSFSTHFHPENILVDDPSNTKSRWTTQNSEPAHWIILRLNKLSVLKSITFGKYQAAHPCNMKEFKVYVGTIPENMTEVLHSSLKNDSIRETFSIRHLNSAGCCFPTRFIKIEPLSVYGQSYNTSIWHISLTGIINEACVEEVQRDYDQFRETRVMQHILKHLRQRRLLTPYNSILAQTGIQLEHPLVTKLYESIVLAGDWDKAENILQNISEAGLFDQYLQSSQPRAIWREIHDTDANGDIPSVRGGHAMCIDSQRGYIYLFGGWDGQKSLNDFWRYDIKQQRWAILSHNTSFHSNAPGPRSCHKMVYDSKTNCIYILGRLNDSDKPTKPRSSAQSRNTEAEAAVSTTQQSSTTTVGADETPTLASRPMLLAEFYRYHCEEDSWERLDIDANGPRTIFDHQMIMDSEAQMLYVFGGRAAEKEYEYSGLYSYDVQRKNWNLLQTIDSAIPSRFGHSMIFDPPTRQLYIFAGDRDEKFLSDMYIYDIATNKTTEIFSDFTSSGGPQPCFTQRAVIDPSLQEMYIFGGLIHNHATLSEPSIWLYRYSSRPGKWEKIDALEEHHRVSTPSSSPQVSTRRTPPSRFAHQVVYDPNSKTLYLHGGTMMTDSDPTMPSSKEKNDGQSEAPMKRLSDFWKLTLWRLSSKELIRRSAYLLRQQRFREMCETQLPVQSLRYLQNDVSEVVNHEDPSETQLFRSLLTHLLTHSSSPHSSTPAPSASTVSDQPASHVVRSDSVECPSETPSPADNETQAEDRGEGMYHPPHLSEECFGQRTKSFEAILEFIADNAKQPAGSLLNLVDIDADLL
ncbi:Muskelin N-terminus-domain-containing protein [Lentinula raphanica]|nr:Muskelin N-terminus-domain-containing protein [Lentinula raphanica]